MKKLVYALYIMVFFFGTMLFSCGAALESEIILAEDGFDEEKLFEEEPFGEDDLFSDEDFLVEEEAVVGMDVGAELNKEKIGVTGLVKTNTIYTKYSSTRDWSGLGGAEHGLENLIAADLFLDIRLRDGVKSFLNLAIDYFPAGKEEIKTVDLPDETTNWFADSELPVTSKEYTDIRIKEFFLDINWRNRVYFRTGKQVLKWGRSYFWNPTDLINIEKRTFLIWRKPGKGVMARRCTPLSEQPKISIFL